MPPFIRSLSSPRRGTESARTTQTRNTIQFGRLGKGRGWKDLFVVSFLALVLGAFVAQISTSHRSASQDQPVAWAASTAAARG